MEDGLLRAMGLVPRLGSIFGPPFGASRRRTPRARSNPRVASERSRRGASLGTLRSTRALGVRIGMLRDIEKKTLVPRLAACGIKQMVHGPDTHSVDHSPILGRAPVAITT